MTTKRKVLAYITKGQESNLELLVFKHRDHPEAGLQVPGGTVEEGELLVDALFREIKEETGIDQGNLHLIGNIYTYNYSPVNRETIYERIFFHLTYHGDQKVWDHLVMCKGEDNGLMFQYRWEPLASLPLLAGEQGAALHELKKNKK